MPRAAYCAAILLVVAGLTGCTDDEAPPAGPARADVIASYGELVQLSYDAALADAEALKTAVDAFVAAPSEQGLEDAKSAWLTARQSYCQTEAFRFYGGPIDDPEDGPEPRINSWPLDESYIDYVAGAADAGIINDPSIEISSERIRALDGGAEGDIFNQGQGFDPDKAISTGYHAIEFLLWGQDASDSGPGARPWQDYLTTAGATAANGDRRGLYLTTVTAMLVDDLGFVATAWQPGEDNFRRAFAAADPDEGLRKIITAVGILSKGELAGERMDVALDSLDQEDEHSCFSDSTHVDLAMDALGIENVYLGRYGDHDGLGIDELVAAADPAVDQQMKALLTASRDAIAEIPPPFDQAISENGSPGWLKVDAAVNALFDQGDYFVPVAESLGLGTISVELPD